MVITFGKIAEIIGTKQGYIYLLAQNGWKKAKGFKLDNRIWVMKEKDALVFVAQYGEDKLEELKKHIAKRRAII